MQALIGRKLGMTQVLNEDGVVVPVTLIQAGPCVVTQIRNSETDGYNALQLGFETAKKLNKAQKGHLKTAGTEAKVTREFRIGEDTTELKVGDKLDVSAFSIGDSVSVSSISKGKGFAGTVKRHNFRTSKKSHGGNGAVREPGSIGSMYPQKVMKGKRMAGRMGGEMTTVKNQAVALIDPELQVIGIRGMIPGPRKSLVTITGASA